MILLVIMGLRGQMLYRWRVGLVPATFVTDGINLIAIMTGHASEAWFKELNDGLNAWTHGAPLATYFDPTLAGFKGAGAKIMPSLFFWAIAISVFCYAGSAQPGQRGASFHSYHHGRSPWGANSAALLFSSIADISTNADDFVESATMNPAFEESAMFENMVDLMLKDDYDLYVFDTAPTANARRLLGMSKVYSLWVDRMLKSREEARTLRVMLSFSKKKEEDPLMGYLLQLRERMAQARQRLTDSERTAFFFVTLPEALPIAVISRFIGWLISVYPSAESS